MSAARFPLDIERLSPQVLRLRVGPGPPPGRSYLADRPPVFVEHGAGPAAASVAWQGSRLVFRDIGGIERWHLVAERSLTGAEGLRLVFELVPGQHFYGLGHGGQPFDRLGATRRLSNRHVNHGGGSDIAVPLLVAQVGYALFFDETSPAVIDPGLSGDATELAYLSEAAGLDLYVLAGGDLAETLALAATLLGHPSMPPRWALGYLQSTRHFTSAAEIVALADAFRARGLPCDALIFLSSYGLDRGWNAGVGRLDPDAALFADLPARVEALHARGIRVVLHEYPVLAVDGPGHAEAVAEGHLLADDYAAGGLDGTAAATYFAGQRFLDFTRPAVGDWWWDQHRALCEAGVDGWWLDGGEGPRSIASTRNRYDLGRQAAFARGEARTRPDRRPFLLCRSGGPGMQVHGAASWSGDVDNSFATLEQQVALGLNAGLSGLTLWGSDIGGYYSSRPEDGELFARWFWFGAFTPIFRAHGRAWRNRLPWSFGPAVEAACMAALALRYRLLPYTYSLAWQAHRTGLPIMRPLVLADPEDPRLWDLSSAYLWGNDLLVCPVTRAGALHWPVVLPKGRWTDFWTGETYHGGGAVEVAAPLDQIPLFVRAGAIIPVATLPGSGMPDAATQSLIAYPGGSTCFDLYEDDGETRAWERGDFALTRLTSEGDDAGFTIRLAAPTGTAARQDRPYSLAVHAPGTAPASVSMAGQSGDLPWSAEPERFITLAIPSHPATVEIRWS